MAKYCECGQERLKHIPPELGYFRPPTTEYYLRNSQPCKGYIPDRAADTYCVNCKQSVHVPYRQFVLIHMQGKCMT